MKDYTNHSMLKRALECTADAAENLGSSQDSPFHLYLAFLWLNGYENGNQND